MIDIDFLYAIAAGGASASQIIAVVEANQKLEAEKRAAKRERERQRQRRHRQRHKPVSVQPWMETSL